MTIRPPNPGDAEVLIAGRDDVFHHFLGEGDPDPRPLGCIEVGGEVIGWVDYDLNRSWLEPGEVNVGYNVFAPHRGLGYTTRAVQLLIHHLAVDTDHRVATLLIDAQNDRSLALAQRARFPRVADLDGHPYFKRPVPPLAYTDGVVTIRRLGPDDLDTHIEATDEMQITWLWLDLANERVPAGEANISYAANPSHRGNGYVRRAVALILDFLRDHTGARTAHITVDDENEPSRRVAHAAGAVETEAWVDDQGRTMVRHVIDL